MTIVTAPTIAQVVRDMVAASSAAEIKTLLDIPESAITDGDKGDILVSGAGSTWAIEAGAVNLAKQADMATASLVYRKAAGTGPPEVQTLVMLKSDLGLTGTNSGDQASIVGITGTLAQFNTALTDADFATGGGTASGTNSGDQTIVLTGPVTGSGSGSFATTITNSAVTLAKMADVATATLFYRKAAGTGAPEIQTLATLKTDLGLSGTNSGDQTIGLTGDVSGSGTGSFAATIASDAVTYAKIQNVSAAARALGRKTAGAGDVEELTLSELLDFIGPAAQGDILYRGASSWERMAAGTSGLFLRTLGPGANPAWATVSGSDPWTRIGLASDFVNATVSFSDVAGWSSTIAANSNFCIEVEAIMVAGAASTNLPRFGFNWNAALAHGVAEIEYHSSATAKVLANFANLTTAGNAQSAAGTAIAVSQPYALWAQIRGRTGAGAVTFKGQLAAETAAASAAILKVGSEYRTRTVS